MYAIGRYRVLPGVNTSTAADFMHSKRDGNRSVIRHTSDSPTITPHGYGSHLYVARVSIRLAPAFTLRQDI